jgi:hypothetical protein
MYRPNHRKNQSEISTKSGGILCDGLGIAMFNAKHPITFYKGGSLRLFYFFFRHVRAGYTNAHDCSTPWKNAIANTVSENVGHCYVQSMGGTLQLLGLKLECLLHLLADQGADKFEGDRR